MGKKQLLHVCRQGRYGRTACTNFPVMSSILDIVLDHANRNNAKKVVRINLRIGHLSDIIPEWAQSYFDMLSKDTIADHASLEIEARSGQDPVPRLRPRAYVQEKGMGLHLREMRIIGHRAPGGPGIFDNQHRDSLMENELIQKACRTPERTPPGPGDAGHGGLRHPYDRVLPHRREGPLPARA